MKRTITITFFILFLISVAVFMAFGPQIRAALSPEIRYEYPVMQDVDGQLMNTIPASAVWTGEDGESYAWRVSRSDEFPESTFVVNAVPVPDELIEAARLDTGSTLKIIWHIIVPTIRPGIICAWVLSFTEQWNAVAEPIILMETREKYPLAILLNEIQPGDVLGFAATLMFFLAPLLLFSFFEDEVMEGLGDYGLK